MSCPQHAKLYNANTEQSNVKTVASFISCNRRATLSVIAGICVWVEGEQCGDSREGDDRVSVGMLNGQ